MLNTGEWEIQWNRLPDVHWRAAMAEIELLFYILAHNGGVVVDDSRRRRSARVNNG